ncbi:hypothetical protein LMH87_012258 [Akanthomyces muscarius]|uniref:Uncharacterized protein n=1 Tax=Akanthomyces muscarius TaxID=2231603 RepID=A0A9W8UKR1_AKAMU|nr:hypothetical protein LMH87_012258 [Akanthomyces muscarius]KAJ4151567.1 hypothetical protein LMH87_012258 [Akanthomyces muscarius]
MALWPFRRKTVRSPSRPSPVDDRGTSPTRNQMESIRHTASRNGHAGTPAPRASVRKKQRPEPNKLQRRARTYSFSPNRHETIRVGSRGRPQQSQHFDSDSAWTRAPTLYLKRDPNHPPIARRKSSKRRHEDHEREAEIKAMSHHMPKVPTDRLQHGSSKHSIKRSKTSQHSDQISKRTSELSLPLPDSMQSSLSGDSDMTSYKVSIFDSLAPRPTLRYGTGVKRTPSRASASAHPASPKGLLSEDNTISEEMMQPRKRIDDLADDLDAKALRELMDRDAKRRQRERTREQAKTKKKIADATERHKQEAEAARKSGSPSPSNMERGVMGRELVGLGLDPASTVVTSSRQRASQSPELAVASESQPPLQVFHRTDTLPSEDAGQDTEASSGRPVAQSVDQEDSALIAPPASRLSSLLKSKKSRSKSTLGSEKDKLAVPNDEDQARKGSEASTGKPTRLSISSLLKWNSRNKRSSGPSSFSNTSREEMQAVASAQAQAEALARLQGDDVRSGSADNPRIGSSLSGNYVAGKVGNAPKRTRSRFREDLDDFPTPPDSRVQSPEAEPPVPSIADSKHDHATQPIPIPGRGTPYAFGQRSVEKLRERALTEGSGSYTAPSPDQHLSMSLASIDSEGSWLSGNRRSGTLRDSLLRANRQAQRSSSPAQSLDEELGITEDEYMTRLTPNYHSQGAHVRRSEEGRPSSDEDESDLKWGAVGARPHFVHRVNRGTVHSQQALVNIDSADEESIIEAST